VAQEFYDRFYGDATDSLRQWRLLGAINKSQSVLDLTADLRIRDVIDIGSGTGALLELLAPLRPTWRFEAVDIAASAVQTIEALSLPNVEARLFDGSHLPYKDGEFGLAIMSHVVEHLEDTQPLLQEAARVARWLCIEVPVEGTPVLDAVSWLRAKAGRPRIPNTIGHLRFCSRREWDRLFADNGLTILRRRQYTVQKEVLFFGKHGAGLIEERVKLLGQRILGRRIWADLYHSNYAVLAKGVH